MTKNIKLKEAVIISFAFLFFELFLVSFHEMWRDEIQDWAITLNSHSISELFHLTRYEAQGKLWYIILYVLQMMTSNIFYDQLLHVGIAALSVFVFCYFSPLNKVQNILFCFGYFFAYEYSIMCRNYVIEVLLIFLSAGIYLKYQARYFLLNSIVLLLLFQTNIYGVIIGFVFYCYMILTLAKASLLDLKRFAYSVFIVTCGLILSIYFIIPPPDVGPAPDWTNHFNPDLFMKVISTPFTAYFPFPKFWIEFWNTNFMDSYSYKFPEVVLSILVITSVTLIFKSKKRILLLYFAGTLGLLLFCYFRYLGYQRHHGQLFLLFVLCYWLYISESKNESITSSTMIVFLRKYFIILILLVSLAATCVASYYEIRYPFSNATNVVEYLKSNSLDEMVIAGDEAPSSSIAGLLNKEIYFPQSKRWGTYIVFDSLRQWFPDSIIIAETKKYFAQSKEDYLLILTHPLDSIPENWQFLKGFDHAIVNDENYYLYKVQYSSTIKNQNDQ